MRMAVLQPRVIQGIAWIVEVTMNLKKTPHTTEFMEILGLIHSGRTRAFEAVNVVSLHRACNILRQPRGRLVGPSSWLGSAA